MHTKSLFALLSIGLLFSACKKELEPQESSVPLTPPVAQAAPNMPAVPGQQTAPQSVAPSPAAMTPVPQPGQAVATATGMNPPHGQPNHRCDIAVGAPLNSPPGKTAPAQPAMTINPAQMKQQGTRMTPATSTPALLNPGQAVATAPGMNPPHGQAGHRCDIAVGAPLNSPVKAAETKTEATPKMDITVSDPVKAEPKKAE